MNRNAEIPKLDGRILTILWDAFSDDTHGNPTNRPLEQCEEQFVAWLRGWEQPQEPGPLRAALLVAYGPENSHRWEWTGPAYYCAKCDFALTPSNANGECPVPEL